MAEIQRSEWGDVVPILRSFGYDGRVLNLSYSGHFYETELNWEWDPVTLEMVDHIGWGPGLEVGEFVKVQVLQPDGSPAANAAVWADGRIYSFSLPNRPYPTDANGYARIPLGADLDRTALVLRATDSGMASPTVIQPAGQPADAILTLAPE